MPSKKILVVMLCDDHTPEADQAIELLVRASVPFWMDDANKYLGLWVGHKGYKGLEEIKAFVTEYREVNRSCLS